MLDVPCLLRDLLVVWAFLGMRQKERHYWLKRHNLVRVFTLSVVSPKCMIMEHMDRAMWVSRTMILLWNSLGQ